MKKVFSVLSISFCLLLISFVIAPQKSYASGFGGTGVYGDFSGSFNYVASDATDAILTITLTNSSPLANGGYLTGIVFNNPNNDISGVSLVASDSNFDLIGGPNFNDSSIKAAPYGHFDIGAALGSDWEGGGTPTDGIAAGDTGTFTFTLTGTLLDTLTSDSFANELSSGKNAGSGYEPFVARFKGFKNGKSDKVLANDKGGPGGGAPTPEPSTMLLFAFGIVGLFFRFKMGKDLLQMQA